MDLKQFSPFGDDSRLWVYVFDKTLDALQCRNLAKRLTEFTSQWTSHGSELNGTYAIYQNQIALLALREKTTLSGCSIDGSVRVFKDFELSSGANALNRSWVFFLNEKEEIQKATRSEFADSIVKGRVGEKTFVVDATISTLGELRLGGLFKPFNQSWHQKAFPLPDLTV